MTHPFALKLFWRQSFKPGEGMLSHSSSPFPFYLSQEFTGKRLSPNTLLFSQIDACHYSMLPTQTVNSAVDAIMKEIPLASARFLLDHYCAQGLCVYHTTCVRGFLTPENTTVLSKKIFSFWFDLLQVDGVLLWNKQYCLWFPNWTWTSRDIPYFYIT